MNHQSLLDASVGPLTQCTQRISNAVAKAEIVNWLPILRLYQPSTFIFIKRPKRNANGEIDNTSARETIKKFAYYINKGLIGWICPEGTRNNDFRTKPLLPLRKGFLFALENVKCDIIVMIYRDTGELINQHGDVYEGCVVA